MNTLHVPQPGDYDTSERFSRIKALLINCRLRMCMFEEVRLKSSKVLHKSEQFVTRIPGFQSGDGCFTACNHQANMLIHRVRK
ncbi:hypothetical protein BDR05DRAFT_969124 [Suillus weaverae]|nr:hypothetical protein BDR05DRAFT_969124 [Suillus weaverae]